MKVKLFMDITIDTDKLDSVDRDRMKQECEWAGFPISDENLAWFVAEDAANEITGLFGYAVNAEVAP